MTPLAKAQIAAQALEAFADRPELVRMLAGELRGLLDVAAGLVASATSISSPAASSGRPRAKTDAERQAARRERERAARAAAELAGDPRQLPMFGTEEPAPLSGERLAGEERHAPSVTSRVTSDARHDTPDAGGASLGSVVASSTCGSAPRGGMPRALLSLSDFKEKRERAARDGSHAVHVGGELPAELRELPEVAKRVASTPGLDLEIVWAKFSRWASSRAPWRPEDFAAAWVRWVMNERVSVAPRASPATDELRRPYHAEFEDDGELERMTQEQIIANREHAKRALEALG